MDQDILIHGRERDLGGFIVHRSLPSAQKRFVGPFVFLDHMSIKQLDRTHAMDVRPHPHIGLATVTYLFEGRGMHRDSLGSEQMITPGDLNWMTAGRGIVHSERTPPQDREASAARTMHGVQIWVGLPVEHEECEPTFAHWPKEKLPFVQVAPNLKGKVLVGEYKEVKSPVITLSSTLFLDLNCESEVKETLSFQEKEIGIFLASGSAQINGQFLAVDDIIVVSDPSQVQVHIAAGSRLIVIGGEPFPEPRYIWWNFVSSSKERIHKAADDWKNQKIGQVPGENEFIPLPNDKLP